MDQESRLLGQTVCVCIYISKFYCNIELRGYLLRFCRLIYLQRYAHCFISLYRSDLAFTRFWFDIVWRIYLSFCSLISARSKYCCNIIAPSFILQKNNVLWKFVLISKWVIPIMVFISKVISWIGAHVRSNLSYLTCIRLFISSGTYRVFLPEKTYFPSCLRNI